MALIDDVIIFLKKEEGLREDNRAYLDPPENTKNQYSIGYGHLITKADINAGRITLSPNNIISIKGVGGKDTITTRDQAYELLTKDLQWRIDRTASIVGNAIWSKLSNPQKVAFISYVYNAGDGGFQKFFNESGIKSALEAGDYTKAGEILRDKGVRTANGKVDAGLIDRRKKEGELVAGTTLSPGQEAPIIPTNEVDDYFTTTYTKPIKDAGFNRVNDFIGQKAITIGYDAAEASYAAAPIQEVVSNTALMSDAQLSGELALLQGVASVNTGLESQATSILSRIDNFLPSEAAFLVQYDLFEFLPDVMRQEMSANAGNGQLVDYTHAWRAPGKLAITADITIPGAAGFRIGQIFWIGRTYEHYKQFGAFQLFGLTENIDINKGWTTSLHSRFNAMPTIKIAGLQSE